MQKTGRLISEQVYNKHPEYSKEFIHSLNVYIFKKLKDEIKEGNSLIYFLPPLGNFQFRCKEINKFVAYQSIKEEKYQDEELLKLSEKVLKNYDVYREDKLNAKYERFGKESHEAYLLARKEENLRKWKETKSK